MPWVLFPGKIQEKKAGGNGRVMGLSGLVSLGALFVRYE
jgi:hypothetical protein